MKTSKAKSYSYKKKLGYKMNKKKKTSSLHILVYRKRFIRSALIHVLFPPFPEIFEKSLPRQHQNTMQ